MRLVARAAVVGSTGEEALLTRSGRRGFLLSVFLLVQLREKRENSRVARVEISQVGQRGSIGSMWEAPIFLGPLLLVDASNRGSHGCWSVA